MEQLKIEFEVRRSDYSKSELALLTPEDIYARADEHLLRVMEEDRRIEHKPASIHAEELGQYFSMWANTPGGGLIVVGQRDKKHGGGFYGCCVLPTQAGVTQIEKGGLHHCPDANIRTRRVLVTNTDGKSDFVLMIHVEYHERRVVKTIAGKAYARCGDEKITLSADQIRALEAEKGQIDLELEPVSLQFPQDFRQDLVRQYVDNLVAEKGLSEGHSDAEILTHTHLGRMRRDVFIPNKACALLFAKDPLTIIPGCRIFILRYEGEYEQSGKSYNVVKRIEVEGCIPALITEAAKHVRSQLREFSPLSADNRFEVLPEYPEDAWHEAIVNACVHRSYLLKNIVTFVKIFDDRFIVESPGGFPPTVTPDNIYNTSSPRNPHLFFALHFLKFVKCHGEGTRRMRDTMAQSELPKPEFIESAEAAGFSQFRVTLRNNFTLRKLWIDSEALRVLGPKWAELQQNELRIMNFVAEHGSINVTQAMRLVLSPRKWQSVKKVLDGMKERGLLVRHHSKVIERDSRAVYTLPDKSPAASAKSKISEDPS